MGTRALAFGFLDVDRRVERHEGDIHVRGIVAMHVRWSPEWRDCG